MSKQHHIYSRTSEHIFILNLKNLLTKTILLRAVAVAQLVEWSLPIPEVHSRIQSSAKFILNIFYCQLHWKDKNKEKEAENGPVFKKYFNSGDLLHFNHYNTKWGRLPSGQSMNHLPLLKVAYLNFDFWD